MRSLIPVVVLGMSACSVPTVLNEHDDRLDAIEQQDLAGLLARIDALETDNEAMKSQLGALAVAAVTSDDLTDYATVTWVSEQGYLAEVYWSDLLEVPSGFADGVDNGADSVSWGDLTDVPAGLDDGDDVGLTAVAWTDIGDRPAGLDDGDDVGVTEVGWSDIADVPGDLLYASSLAAYTTTVELTSWLNSHDFATMTYVDAGDDPLSTRMDGLASGVGDLTDRLPSDGSGVVGLIAEDLVLYVDTSCDEISAHLSWLGAYRIHSDAVVTLQIADGVYSCSGRIEVRHPDGDRLHIVGNPASPESVVLNFAGSGAVEVTMGHVLGRLDGLTLVGDGTPARAGVMSDKNAVVFMEDAVVVHGFSGAGVRADMGGVIAANGVYTHNNGDGVHASHGGVVRVTAGETSDNNDNGVLAQYGSVVFGTQLYSHDNGDHGVSATGGSAFSLAGLRTERHVDEGVQLSMGSSGMLDGATVESSGRSGIVVVGNSVLSAVELSSNGNGEDGLYVAHGSFASVDTVTAAGNARAGLGAEDAGLIYYPNASYTAAGFGSGNTGGNTDLTSSRALGYGWAAPTPW